MAEYQLTETDDYVIRTVDSAWIPNDSLNADRIEYEAWLADGGVPDPYKKPFIVSPFDMGRTIAQRLNVQGA